MRNTLLLSIASVLALMLSSQAAQAESCTARMPTSVSHARGYTFTGTLVKREPGYHPEYTFAVQEVFAGEDRPVAEPVPRELSPGGQVTFIGSCYPLRHLTSGPIYLISTHDLLSLSSMYSVAWVVSGDGSITLIRQFQSRGMDPRFASVSTLAEAIELLVPELPPTDGIASPHNSQGLNIAPALTGLFFVSLLLANLRLRARSS